ncbi:hypothetical protein T4D_7849 [Trichinella pseudospiralis]|uniref:Uncharacterized protein n=1 Tax=Trichinella pseudospiralis TaxID=6337 RepID=A0A0V1DMW1_TRIPS|nr:hypothetical protein T4D_7849 [Trichinella pseudospiralis]
MYGRLHYIIVERRWVVEFTMVSEEGGLYNRLELELWLGLEPLVLGF